MQDSTIPNGVNPPTTSVSSSNKFNNGAAPSNEILRGGALYSDRFLTRIIYASGLVLAVFLILLGWMSLRVHKAAKVSMEKTVRAEGSLAHLTYLDMVLSGFARTAVTRGEIRWENRYAAIEPKAQEVLNEISKVLPGQTQDPVFVKTQEVFNDLRNKERNAFLLLTQNEKQRAYELLSGESYDQLRDYYYQILAELGQSLKNYEYSLIEKGQKELYRSVFILVIAFPVLFISGIAFYRLLRRWETTLRESNKKLQVLNESLHNLAQRLEEMAVTDELTRLFNRRYFYQELKKEMERSKRYQEHLSLLIIDLDHFKKVNDTYGHSAGDIVLKTVAQKIKSGLRTTDFACRYGGEEFVIVLPKTSVADAMNLAERVRQEISVSTVQIENQQELHVTLSIGVGEYLNGETMELLINRADEALYKAKQNGRNQCIFLKN